MTRRHDSAIHIRGNILNPLPASVRASTVRLSPLWPRPTSTGRCDHANGITPAKIVMPRKNCRVARGNCPRRRSQNRT
jgi:hypothetical protein